MPKQPQRHALVTGASVGIGAAFAARLAHDGYNVITVARDRQRLEAQARRLERDGHVTVEVLAADLTRHADLERVEARIAERPALDLLVNNAGFGSAGAFAKLAVDGEEGQIRLNVTALLRLTRAALPGMIARRHGAIINVSSMAAFQPGPYMATYSATKAFVNSFTESLHEEVRGTGVRVQALCPGFTRTEFQRRAGIDTSSLPSFVWMTPEAVVEASLNALRSDTVVCVPGLANRALATLAAAVPHRLASRAYGFMGKRLLG